MQLIWLLSKRSLSKDLPALKFIGRGPSGESCKVDWTMALVDWVSITIAAVEI
jgi:hypothetical protein